jgi:CheY-like chemotaxis protein
MSLLKTRILLVDDDLEFREMVKSILTENGCVVTEAEDGLQAKDVFDKEVFDAVIADTQMPKMDGIKLLKYVKQKGSTPFILMTGFSGLIETQNAHELGADQFLSKPFSKNDILALGYVTVPQGTKGYPVPKIFS